MAKQFLRTIRPHVRLYRDPKTGIAWVENGEAGISHSCHPNISRTGSVRGMKSRGYWGKNDRTVRSHGFIYNIDICHTSDDLDKVACAECRCGGNHGDATKNKQDESNCPVCEKWIDVDSRGRLKKHLDWLQNECKGGKSNERSKLD